MGARQSADDAPTSPKSPASVTPAEFARRELAKPVDDDALPPRSSAPVRPVTEAPSLVEEVPPSNTAPPSLQRQQSRRLSRRNSGQLSGGNADEKSQENAPSGRERRAMLKREWRECRDMAKEDKNVLLQETLVLKGHTDAVWGLAALDGDRLASSSDDKSVIIWSVADGTQLAKLEGHTHDVLCLAALDGDRLASGSRDKSIIIWSLADCTQLDKLEGHTNIVACLAALDDSRLASGSYKSIIIWNLTDGTQLATLEGVTHGVSSLAALDGGRLASLAFQEIIIWDLADSHGKQLAKLKGISSLAALDGNRLASGSSDDKSVIIWSLADGTRLATLEGHTQRVSCLAALADERLASFSRDNTIRIWNVAADAKDGKAPYGDALMVMWGHKGGIISLVALDDGRLASGGSYGTIRIRRARDSSAALRIAECGSAFEFEVVARECREKNVLDDLLDAAEHHGLAEELDEKKRDASSSSSAIVTQAQVFDAIATVVNEEEDSSKTIESLAPRVLDLVRDDRLLPDMERRGVSNAAIQKLASSPLFRAVLDAKFAAGPRFVLYCELFLYFALMFCFARISGLEILGWAKWFVTEKIAWLCIGFIVLAYFSLREIGQMVSARRVELFTEVWKLETPLGDLNDFGGYHVTATGLAWYALAIPRYVLLFLVCLVQLPIFVFFKIRDGLASDSKNVDPEREDRRAPRTLLESILRIRARARDRNHEELWEGAPFIFRLYYPTARRIIHDPLTFVGVPRAWRRDYWNWIDLATLACAWASFVREALPDGRLGVNLAAFTAILLWIRLCGFLKLVDIELATFVLMIGRIIFDIKVFLFFLLVIILMFASALYLHLGQRTRSDFGFHDDGAPTGYTTFPKTMLSLYLLGFVGEFDWDTFDTYALRVLICLFIFIVIVVLLNVLIAIVSNSHGASEKIAAGLFYRSRLEYIIETAPVRGKTTYRGGWRLLPSWLRQKEDEASIKQRLKEALAQHKDDAEADPVRESEERTKKELAAMKTQIDKLTDMLQTLIDNQQT